MNEIRDWTARRSGAFITITGKDAEGQEITVTQVTSIESDAPFPVATNERGDRFTLLTVD